MIITYPISIPYTKGNQQRVVPDSLFSNSEVLSGSYPMGKNRFWHGGTHIHPADLTKPIVAIADGEIIAYRYDEVDKTDSFFDKTPYSRSFVLIKHETELGQTALGTSKLVFYSLYMHLQAWGQVKSKSGNQAVNFLRKEAPATRTDKAQIKDVQPIADGTCKSGSGYLRVRRGDILGYPGTIPDNLTSPTRGFHFEIFFDDITFLENPHKTIWGRCLLSCDLSAYKELLPKSSLTVDPTKPIVVDTASLTSAFWKIKLDRHNYWVSSEQMISKDVETPDPRHRNRTITKTQQFSKSSTLTAYQQDPSQNEVKLRQGTLIVAWMEPLLRPGEFSEELMNGKKWVQVFVTEANKLYWVEKDSLQYTCDADWKDFQKIADHGAFSEDGFIDDDGLKAILDSYDKNCKEQNVDARLADEKKLKNIFARHPTEWSNQDIATRFSRVTRDEFGPSKLSPDQFTKLTEHISRLSFWEQVTGLPQAKNVWHAHPIRFIEHLARCMWLSKEEFTLILPNENFDKADELSHGTTEEVREKYRAAINTVCYQYGINSRMRQLHFYGQAAVECMSLNSMLELESGEKYNGSAILGNCQPGDGPKFKGRGLKQLTGRFNYSKFWTYKGWIKPGKDFDLYWESDSKKRVPKIDNPEIIERPHFCIETGAWYITILRPTAAAAMDADNIVEVTKIINGADKGLGARKKMTNRIRKVLL